MCFLVVLETLYFTSELMLLFVQENMCPNKTVDHVVSRLVRLFVNFSYGFI